MGNFNAKLERNSVRRS